MDSPTSRMAFSLMRANRWPGEPTMPLSTSSAAAIGFSGEAPLATTGSRRWELGKNGSRPLGGIRESKVEVAAEAVLVEEATELVLAATGLAEAAGLEAGLQAATKHTTSPATAAAWRLCQNGWGFLILYRWLSPAPLVQKPRSA